MFLDQRPSWALLYWKHKNDPLGIPALQVKGTEKLSKEAFLANTKPAQAEANLQPSRRLEPRSRKSKNLRTEADEAPEKDS